MPSYLIERTIPGAGQMDEATLASTSGRSNRVRRDLGLPIHATAEVSA